MALVPPPRSSLPRKPQREVFFPPEMTRTTLSPAAFAWFTYSTPASIRP